MGGKQGETGDKARKTDSAGAETGVVRPDVGPRRRSRTKPGTLVAGGLMRWPAAFVRAGRNVAGTTIRRESPAERHAAGVWESARRQVGLRQQGVRARPWRPGRLGVEEIAWDLTALSLVAEHVSTCRTCLRVWVDGDRPVDYLVEALMRSGVRDVVTVLELSRGAEAG